LIITYYIAIRYRNSDLFYLLSCLVQFTYWNLKGRRIPILVAEQGIGRGALPITTALNVLGDGAGGDWSTTYAPKPLYISNYNRSVLFENSEVSQ
jgi:hypothetical protein